MSEPFPREALFASALIDDEAFAEAYETVGARRRARLKGCIAVLYESLGETPACERREQVFRQGFVLVDEDAGPSACVTVVCDDSYPWAEGLLAALMPALVAGARPDVLFRRRHGAVSPFLLTALELAGVEEARLLPDADILDFFRRSASGDGRLVLIGEDFFGGELVLEAHRRGLLCRSLVGLPSGSPDAAMGDGSGANSSVFFWPHLAPSWFRQRSRTANPEGK